MLFKKKDSNESSKAKTSLFASKAKKDEALAVHDDAKTLARDGSANDVAEQKTLKQTVAQGRVNAGILLRPRITEKATNEAAKNVYTFDVATTANKKLIAEAMKDVYGVTPKDVKVVTIPKKHVVSRRGIHGYTKGGKKAYVYLKKGDTIELV